MKEINKLIIIFTLLFSSALWGETTENYMHGLQVDAERKVLWQEKEWLNLLHYRKQGLLKEGFESAVDDDNFFLSKNGKLDPKAELKETLSSFFIKPIDDNKHAQCRFVARLQWLSSRLNIEQQRLPLVECKEYNAWHEKVDAQRVTLIFPAYYLNSPSSMYGHTLLRLDPVKKDNQSNWLSFAVNFGANVTDEDNSLAYTYKGLTGGYPGQFIVAPYYEKILEYSRMERRDIWEYELNLQPLETQKLVEHLWELKNIRFDYFFFTENCSYRLLELLEVARPGVELTEQFKLTAIPVDTIRAVEKAGLITGDHYLPSNEAVLKSMLLLLSDSEREALHNLVEDIGPINTSIFEKMSPKRARLLAEIAYKLQRFRQNRKARDPAIAKKSYQLLSLINKYPHGVAHKILQPANPDKSHHSQRVAFRVGERDKHSYTELEFRMAFHSLEDNELGFLRGAQINMGKISVRHSNNNYYLQKLELIDIFSLTPRDDFFDPLSWRVRTGLERVHLNGKDHLVSHLSAGGGGAWSLSKDSTAYLLLTARLEGSDEYKAYVEPAAGLAGGLLVYTSFGAGRLEIASEKYAIGQQRDKLSYEQNIVLSRDQSIRLSFNREKVSSGKQFSEFSIGYHLNF